MGASRSVHNTWSWNMYAEHEHVSLSVGYPRNKVKMINPLKVLKYLQTSRKHLQRVIGNQHKTILWANWLTMADLFFITCVFQSHLQLQYIEIDIRILSCFSAQIANSGNSCAFADCFRGGGFSPTQLKNMRKSNWIISPGIGVKIQKYLKPPPCFEIPHAIPGNPWNRTKSASNKSCFLDLPRPESKHESKQLNQNKGKWLIRLKQQHDMCSGTQWF